MSSLLAAPVVAAAGGRPSVATLVLAVAGALIVAVLLAEAVAAGLRALGRRGVPAAHLAHATRNPVRLVLAVLAVTAAARIVADPPPAFDRWSTVGLVVALTWLAAAVGRSGVAAATGRAPAVGGRPAPTRGSRAVAATASGVVVLVALLGGAAGVLAVFESTRVVALLVGAVALVLLAAVVGALHGWLRDVAAGLELAAADALRVDDVVRVAWAGSRGQADVGPTGDVPGTVWGRVEEITGTSVVLQAWDDRRVVIPARRLAEEGFENWTRRSADLVGTVDIDLAPGVPVAQVRAALLRAVEGNDLWDRRVAVLQVVDATGGRVRVRAVVSAADAPRLADLRCDVREALVEHLARMRPGRQDETAARPGAQAAPSGDTTVMVDPRKDSRLFTGSVFAVERSRVFTGPGEAVLAERDAAVEG